MFNKKSQLPFKPINRRKQPMGICAAILQPVPAYDGQSMTSDPASCT
jgi:hypothetical protein